MFGKPAKVLFLFGRESTICVTEKAQNSAKNRREILSFFIFCWGRALAEFPGHLPEDVTDHDHAERAAAFDHGDPVAL